MQEKIKDDTISRQLVMKTLCERRCGDKPKGCPAGFCPESLAVDCIPSVERKKGNWIGIDDDPCETFECDVCGFVLDDWIQGALYRYCPNCGAWMGGENDATD